MKPRHIKQREGEIRNDYWRSLTPKEQLADLDRRLGKDQGAARQRQKLTAAVKGEK